MTSAVITRGPCSQCLGSTFHVWEILLKFERVRPAWVKQIYYVQTQHRQSMTAAILVLNLRSYGSNINSASSPRPRVQSDFSLLQWRKAGSGCTREGSGCLTRKYSIL